MRSQTEIDLDNARQDKERQTRLSKKPARKKRREKSGDVPDWIKAIGCLFALPPGIIVVVVVLKLIYLFYRFCFINILFLFEKGRFARWYDL